MERNDDCGWDIMEGYEYTGFGREMIGRAQTAFLLCRCVVDGSLVRFFVSGGHLHISPGIQHITIPPDLLDRPFATVISRAWVSVKLRRCPL